LDGVEDWRRTIMDAELVIALADKLWKG